MTRYMYGAADEKFVKSDDTESTTHVTEYFKFKLNPYLRPREQFARNEVPKIFKSTPDLLLNLCINVVDSISLPSVYEWTNVDICRWLKRIGYSHFRNTFRENYINGRTLLLLDATALQAMNIKNFDDIKRLAYFIRCLFFYEMALFCRSISLPPEHYYELYKLFRVRTGPKYADQRRSDLWIRLRILHEKLPHLTHWEVLERWLARIREPTWLFGGVRRRKLFKCKSKQQEAEEMPLPCKECNCMPPCECFWTERDLRKPWRLNCLPQLEKKEERRTINPLIDDLMNKDHIIYDSLSKPTLTVLKKALPQKYYPQKRSIIHFSGQQSSFRFVNAPRRSTRRTLHFGDTDVD